MLDAETEVGALEPRKAALREYFGPGGFERWKAIYGTERVSFIRRSVREGHATVVEQVLAWVDQTAQGRSLRILDAGCGPGVVSLALLRKGHQVVGCDLSEQMVEAARQRVANEPEFIRQQATFIVSDMENVGKAPAIVNSPRFDLAICLDVLLYYPEAELGRILSHLIGLGPTRLIFTYAPASPVFKAMHWLGKRFPRTQRATRLEIIGEPAVRRALNLNNRHLVQQRHISKGFYHVVLAEAAL
jgi:magnesium-protoporphyrin O-methyltransferase